MASGRQLVSEKWQGQSAPSSPSSEGVAECLGSVATNGTSANEGVKLHGRFNRVRPNEGHIHTFGFTVRVTLPSEVLGSWMTGKPWAIWCYKYRGGYRVWIPWTGIRDIPFCEGPSPILAGESDVAVGIFQRLGR